MEERLELRTNESKIAMERLGYLLKDLIETQDDDVEVPEAFIKYAT
jgi:hypothetical protein